MARTNGKEKAGAPAASGAGSGHGRSSRKRVPLRTCISCRRSDSKRALVRVVRTPAAGVLVDPTGKLAGRGAYLCKSRACWESALRGERLARALKTTLTPQEIEALQAFATALAEKSMREADPVSSTVPSSDRA